MTSDDRLTTGLILDVLDVLERHGYHRYDNRHTGQAIGAILDLADVYDGTRDISYGYYPPPASHAGLGPADPEADDAVILTDAEVSTVVAESDWYKEHFPTSGANLRDALRTSKDRHRDPEPDLEAEP